VALLDPAVALVVRDVGPGAGLGVGVGRLRHGEGGLDLGAQRGLVGRDRQQPVGALAGDRPGAEPLERRRDGGEFAGLVGHRLPRARTSRAVVAKAETRCSGAAPALRP